MSPFITFIVVAIICALVMWILGQFPTLDQTFVKFIRIVLLVLLTVMCINVLLVMLFGHSLPFYLGGT